MSFPTCQPKTLDFPFQSKSALAETTPHVTQHVLRAVDFVYVFFGGRVGGIYFPMIQPRGDTEIKHIMVFFPCSGILMLKLAQNI